MDKKNPTERRRKILACMFPWIDFSLLRGNRDRISAIGGTYVRAPFSFLSFESVTVDTVVVVQWKSAFGEEKGRDFFSFGFLFYIGNWLV